MKAALHASESDRLEALRSYDILDTPRESDFDDVVSLAAAICETPISVINLIDNGRQWFKAEVGLGVRETPINDSICAHAILERGLVEVPDTTLDRRFIDNRLVTGDPHLRFYAGALLETPEGLPLGTVCVLDYKPRQLDKNQKAFLSLMASQVMKLLELRRLNAEHHSARLKAEKLLEENEALIMESDHRVMNSLQLVQSVLSMQARSTTNLETQAELKTAHNRVLAIATVHKQLHLSGSRDETPIDEFLVRLCDNLRQTAPAQITGLDVSAEPFKISSDVASALGLIVAELVTNSFKHAYSEEARGNVGFKFRQASGNWVLEVEDFGAGLPKKLTTDRGGGVGMRVLGALVKRLNGKMDVWSEPGHTVFSVTGGQTPQAAS